MLLRFGALHNMDITDLVNPVLLDKPKWIGQGRTLVETDDEDY